MHNGDGFDQSPSMTLLGGKASHGPHKAD